MDGRYASEQAGLGCGDPPESLCWNDTKPKVPKGEFSDGAHCNKPGPTVNVSDPHRAFKLQVWARPLQGGDLAVVLYNSHSLNSVEVAVSWEELHLPAGLAMSVRDVWAGRADPVARGRLSATVAPRDVKWVRLRPAKV